MQPNLRPCLHSISPNESIKPLSSSSRIKRSSTNFLRVGASRFRQILGHEIEQSLQRGDHRVRRPRHARLGEIVGFLGDGSVGDAAIFGLDVDGEFTVGAVAVHAFDVGFDEFPRDLGIFFDVVAPRGDAAKRIVEAVLGEIDQILAAMADGVDAFRRRADDDIDFAAEQGFEFGFGAMRDRSLRAVP